jgi:hypothetical protein
MGITDILTAAAKDLNPGSLLTGAGQSVIDDKTRKKEKLSALVREAGWTGRDATIATAVMMQESGCKTHAISYIGCCFGVAQIYFDIHKESLKKYGITSKKDLMDKPRASLRWSYDHWKEKGWQPWEGYTDGNYKKYLGKDCEVTVEGGAVEGAAQDAANAAGDITGGVGEALGVIAGVFKALLDPSTYFRGGKIAIGSIVLLLGLAAMIFVAISVLSGGSGKGAAKKAANLVPAGKAIKAVT